MEYGKENNIKLVSKLNPNVYGCKAVSKCHGFTFNKDAGMYVCSEGHMAIKKVNNGGKKQNGEQRRIDTYYFDTTKCKVCPKKDGCYKENSRTKSYSIVTSSRIQEEQKKFIESEEFKALYKERYKIEAKNSELKNSYGIAKTYTSGLLNLQLQSAVAIFTCNLKRIITLEKEKRITN